MHAWVSATNERIAELPDVSVKCAEPLDEKKLLQAVDDVLVGNASGDVARMLDGYRALGRMTPGFDPCNYGGTLDFPNLLEQVQEYRGTPRNGAPFEWAPDEIKTAAFRVSSLLASSEFMTLCPYVGSRLNRAPDDWTEYQAVFLLLMEATSPDHYAFVEVMETLSVMSLSRKGLKKILT